MSTRKTLRRILSLALIAAMLMSFMSFGATAVPQPGDPYVALSEDFEGASPYKITFTSGTNSLGGTVRTSEDSKELYLACDNQAAARSNLLRLSEVVRGSVLQVEFDWQVGSPSSTRNAGALVFQTESNQRIFTLLVQNSTASNRFRYVTGVFLTNEVPAGTALNLITTLNA